MIKPLIVPVLFLVFWASQPLKAQSLDDLAFGTSNTFDIATWNIEWFPKRITTEDYVTTIIQQLDAEVLAIQEIDDERLFKDMIATMPGYEVYIPNSYANGLGYVYKSSGFTINAIYKIYNSSAYWSIFPRSPLLMDLTVNNERLILINNHFKCCGDGDLDLDNTNDSEFRRYEASRLLKAYIDDYLPNEKVIILGDLNDLLTDDAANNVFQMYIDDPGNFTFADMAIANGNTTNWSYPNWPSHLDHILVTNELFPLINTNATNVTTIRLDDYFSGGFSSYDYHVSDHRPVGIQLDFNALQISNPSHVSIFTIWPNPTNGVFNMELAKTNVSHLIEIFDIKGRIVYKETVVNAAVISVNNQLNKGVYLLKVSGKNTSQTKQLIIK
jgi:endonuclease/exonuclease/phosphatase family metal-dependent hydrolase